MTIAPPAAATPALTPTVPPAAATPAPTPAPTRTPTPAATPAPRARFRPELHGLRAVAVALVVAYHVWFGRVSGGVDVFFVLTGFLLVGRLAPALERGRPPLCRMWSRNVERLLPAAAMVLLATLVAATVLLPGGRLPQTVHEIVASMLFWENWQLAADSVNYAARNNTASVVQHFWSLSIQGQLLVAVPLLACLLGHGPRARTRLAVALAGLTAASLAFSVHLTAVDQPLAYFHTLTRVWEFGLGGLLALVIDRIDLPRGARLALGWVGVLGLLACGAVLPVASIFPGYVALWPVTCAVLVLVAGTNGTWWGADRLLATPPVQYLGHLSYPLYLWHWPILMFTLVHAGRRHVGVPGGLGVIAGSLVLAGLTHHLVERRSGRRVATAGVAAVLVAAGCWYGVAVAFAAAPAPVDERHPGALALTGGAVAAPDVAALPSMLRVYDDWVHTDYWNCVPMADHPRKVCRQPVDQEAQRRIVVVGDSHVQQFAGALTPLARAHAAQLISLILPGCPFTATAAAEGKDPECVTWNDAALREIAELHPDAVVTMATREVRRGLTENVPDGFVTQWRRLDELGIPVLAVRDNPRFSSSPPDCLQRRGRAAPSCGVARAAVYPPAPPWTDLDVPHNVTFLDTADLYCDAVRCPAEVGNVLVYMDDNHISATYAATLAPLVDPLVRQVFGW